MDERAAHRAYEAGQDYAVNGANTENCHFSLFGSTEAAAAWARGRDDMRAALEESPDDSYWNDFYNEADYRYEQEGDR